MHDRRRTARRLARLRDAFLDAAARARGGESMDLAECAWIMNLALLQKGRPGGGAQARATRRAIGFAQLSAARRPGGGVERVLRRHARCVRALRRNDR